mmetsp:Transcript_127537/g.285323  ORF Transcript_127537/g.285323 Transcript_127537/m.285323 type:complete len:216 (-) Transcript_127537:3-650(-)
MRAARACGSEIPASGSAFWASRSAASWERRRYRSSRSRAFRAFFDSPGGPSGSAAAGLFLAAKGAAIFGAGSPLILATSTACSASLARCRLAALTLPGSNFFPSSMMMRMGAPPGKLWIRVPLIFSNLPLVSKEASGASFRAGMRCDGRVSTTSFEMAFDIWFIFGCLPACRTAVERCLFAPAPTFRAIPASARAGPSKGPAKVRRGQSLEATVA